MMSIKEQLQNAKVIAEVLTLDAKVCRQGLTQEQGTFIRNMALEGAPNPYIRYQFSLKYDRDVDPKTITRYVTDATANGTRSGRPEVISEETELRILHIVNCMRKAGASIKLRTIICIANGLLKQIYPGHGSKPVGRGWARNFCKRRDLHFRKATTSRVVNLETLVNEGTKF